MATADRPWFAILCLLAGVFMLSAMDIAVAFLVRDDMPATEIVALRALLIVPLMLIFFASRSDLSALVPHRVRAQLVRALVGALAPPLVFSGLKYIPLTDAAAVFFSSVFMVAMMSVFLLGERVGPWRWISIFVGYLGVLVVINPTGGGSMVGYLLVFAGAFGYAVVFIGSRLLGRTESVASMVFCFHVVAGLVCAATLPWVWQSPTPTHLALIAFVAVFAVFGHFLMTAAHKFAEASLIAPFEYTAIIWSLAADLLIWKEVLGLTTYVGTSIIVASGLVIAWRERYLQQAG